jgi:Zn-dependent metalloprotease
MVLVASANACQPAAPSARPAVRPVMNTSEPALASDATLRRDPERGTVTFLRAANLSAELERDDAFRALQAQDRYAEVALAFLEAYRWTFGLDRPADELQVRSVRTDELGLKHVRFQQVFVRIPIFGAELNVHLDRANHVYLAQGRYLRTPRDVGTMPRLGQDEAGRVVAGQIRGADPDCRGCLIELVIAAPPGNAARLAYRVRVTVSLTEGWEVLADAGTGAILQKRPTVLRR